MLVASKVMEVQCFNSKHSFSISTTMKVELKRQREKPWLLYDQRKLQQYQNNLDLLDTSVIKEVSCLVVNHKEKQMNGF